jgi:hypothetical protein
MKTFPVLRTVIWSSEQPTVWRYSHRHRLIDHLQKRHWAQWTATCYSVRQGTEMAPYHVKFKTVTGIFLAQSRLGVAEGFWQLSSDLTTEGVATEDGGRKTERQPKLMNKIITQLGLRTTISHSMSSSRTLWQGLTQSLPQQQQMRLSIGAWSVMSVHN